MLIPDNFIEDLLSRIDIVDLIGQYVELKKHGANYLGLCPFHGEKTPSFSVSPSKQFYHCFGCGVSGDAIQFLIEYSGESFSEAVEHLAGRCGLTVPQQQPQSAEVVQQQKQRKQQQKSILDYLLGASNAYQQQLRGSELAITYLKNRGLSGEIAKKFAIGYAPNQWDFLASVFPGEHKPGLLDAGLIIESESANKCYDRFRHRIMFPIRNVRGETIGFGGRIIDQGEPKYLNSPETAVFNKGKELYGIFENKQSIQQQKFALICEGYMDVIALAQHGVSNAVASLGTACTPEHLRLLLRFTKEIVFAFDGDKAGRKAAEKAMHTALASATAEVKLKFLFLPQEHDPDSYIRAYGSESFNRAVQQAKPLSQFFLDYIQNQQDLSITENRAALLSRAQPMWQALPNGFFKQQLFNDIVKLAQLGAHEVMALWKISSNSKHQYKNKYKSSTTKLAAAPPLAANSRRSQQILQLLFSHSSLWDRLTTEEQSLLYQLAPPFGEIFAWYASQLLEFGPQPWAILRNKLKHSASYAQVEAIMTDNSYLIDTESEDPYQELRPLLNTVMVEYIKQQETQILAQLEHDPQALERYRELQERRNLLTKQPSG